MKTLYSLLAALLFLTAAGCLQDGHISRWRVITRLEFPSEFSPISPSAQSSSTDSRNPTSSACHWNTQPAGYLPDSSCTPGAVFQNATTAAICTSGYSASVRNVPDSVKKQVYAEYGITNRSTGEYEVDHLISLELGGSNDISNLFPEPAEPRPGFHEKDKVENWLHIEVCSGKMTLLEAQTIISKNWTAVMDRPDWIAYWSSR